MSGAAARTSDKGRFRVHDARGFDPGTMRRAAVDAVVGQSGGHGATSAVTLLMGRRPDEHPTTPGAEQVITIMFDRTAGSGFQSEAAAEQWWHDNKSWLLGLNPKI